MSRRPYKDHLKGTFTNPSCEEWHSPECLFYKTDRVCKFGDKCAFAHRRVEEQPRKRSKPNGDKRAVALLKEAKNVGCVFQDMEPPKSSLILRKSSTMQKPIRRVRFCTYTHLMHAHFSAHGALTVTFTHLHACHIHARLKGAKKVLCTCVTFLSISPSPFSCLTRLCCSRTVTSRPLLTTASLTLPSTRSCRTFPS